MPIMRPTTVTRRRATAALSAAALTFVAAVLVVAAGPAAASPEGSWTLWISSDGQWQPAERSAADTALQDRAVIAAVHSPTADSAGPPVESADYDTLCPGQSAAAGNIRTAVLAQFGEPGLAHEGTNPEGNLHQCLTLPTTSTAADAYQNAAHTSINKDGDIVAINDYGDHTNTGSSPTTAIWIIAAITIIVIAAITIIIWTRKQQPNQD